MLKYLWKKPIFRLILKNKEVFNISYNKINEDNVKNESSGLITFFGNWPLEEQRDFIDHMRVITDFISEKEEVKLLEEIEPYLKRLRYEFDHWDDAIHGFRETERKKWYPHNQMVLKRVNKIAFDGEIMPYVHVLDLAKEGVIKPHVDSTRYCGSTISGISLLSDCIMRLMRTDSQKYKQTEKTLITTSPHEDVAHSSAYRNQPPGKADVNKFYADLLIPRRSLYIMSHTARYNFTHEILDNDHSEFQGQPFLKKRRISIICRNEP